MNGFVFAFVPTIIFLVVVAPLWIFLHYRSKHRDRTALSDDERLELERLTQMVGRMGDRIETLEAILDAETPDWRKRDGAQ